MPLSVRRARQAVNLDELEQAEMRSSWVLLVVSLVNQG